MCNKCGQFIHRKKKEVRRGCREGAGASKEWKWDLFFVRDFEED